MSGGGGDASRNRGKEEEERRKRSFEIPHSLRGRRRRFRSFFRKQRRDSTMLCLRNKSLFLKLLEQGCATAFFKSFTKKLANFIPREVDEAKKRQGALFVEEEEERIFLLLRYLRLPSRPPPLCSPAAAQLFFSLPPPSDETGRKRKKKSEIETSEYLPKDSLSFPPRLLGKLLFLLPLFSFSAFRFIIEEVLTDFLFFRFFFV